MNNELQDILHRAGVPTPTTFQLDESNKFDNKIQFHKRIVITGMNMNVQDWRTQHVADTPKLQQYLVKVFNDAIKETINSSDSREAARTKISEVLEYVFKPATVAQNQEWIQYVNQTIEEILDMAYGN